MAHDAIRISRGRKIKVGDLVCKQGGLGSANLMLRGVVLNVMRPHELDPVEPDHGEDFLEIHWTNGYLRNQNRLESEAVIVSLMRDQLKTIHSRERRGFKFGNER